MSSGYACPVCGTPQRDGTHLANHLAFTAMLRAEEHETWLDDHAPGWSDEGPDELAERVVEFAEEAEYEEVFEDTVAQSATSSRGHPGDAVHDRGDHGQGDGHDHAHDHAEQGRPSVDAATARSRGVAGGQEQLSGEAAAALDEAREMTQRMYGSDGTDGNGDRNESEDGDPLVDADGAVDDEGENGNGRSDRVDDADGEAGTDDADAEDAVVGDEGEES